MVIRAIILTQKGGVLLSKSPEMVPDSPCPSVSLRPCAQAQSFEFTWRQGVPFSSKANSVKLRPGSTEEGGRSGLVEGETMLVRCAYLSQQFLFGGRHSVA